MSDELQVATRLPAAQELASSFAQPAGGALVTVNAKPPEVITARKVEVKRDHDDIMQEISILAKTAGSNWYYTFPARNEDGSKGEITGPSIKCTDEVARIYGNCRQTGYAMDQGDRWLIRASFVDLERGYVIERDFVQIKRRIGMKTQSSRAEEMALQIGISKAMRNVVHHALRTYVDHAYDEARESFVDKIGVNLERYRTRAADRLKEMDVDITRVERHLGRPTNEWRAQDVAKVIAQIQAINDGMATVDDTWGPAERAAAEPRPTRESVAAEEAQQQQGDGAAAQEGDETVFHVTSLVGEVTSFEEKDAQAAFGEALSALKEASKARGRAGIEAFQESNTGLIDAFNQHNRSDLASQINMMAEALLDSARNPPEQTSTDDRRERPEGSEQAKQPARTRNPSGRGNTRASGRDDPERPSDGAETEHTTPGPAGPSEGRGNNERVLTLNEAREMASVNQPLPEDFYVDRNGEVQWKPGRGTAAQQDLSQGVADQGGGHDSGAEARPSVPPTRGPASKDTGPDTGDASQDTTGRAGQSSPAGHGQTATTPASRSDRRLPMWEEGPDLKVSVPLRGDNTINWQVFRDMLMNIGMQARTKAEHDRYAEDNAAHLQRMNDAYEKYVALIRETWAKQRAVLPD